MAWFQSNTLYVSISLFCLPLLVVIAMLFLPFVVFTIVSLYLCAWLMYYIHAKDDVGLSLPFSPSRVLKVNMVLFSHFTGWIGYLPLIVSYLHWRYWKLGAECFKQIVSLDIPYYNNTKLDVYHPDKKQNGSLSRIIVFVYGGGWQSGSKMIYSTLANTLRELGYVVVVPDYRKYPEVKIDGIYEDIREAIKWTHKHAIEFNGDPEQIYLLGHSAGAHLVSQVVLSDIISQVKYDENLTANSSPPSSPHVSEKHDPAKKTMVINNSDNNNNNNKPHDFLPLVEGLLLFAGVYDIAAHLTHETSRGVEELSAMTRVMGYSQEGYKANSPVRLIERHADLFSDSEDLLDLWPRILFLHGQKDATVGMDQSANMFNTIGKLFPSERRQEVDVRMRLYRRMGHGEPVLALMSNLFSNNTDQKSIIRDIQEFIDI
ncbi:carboxylesterase [Mucor ambiguus]|uniref:Carboxylesterase n=1 Tax=Mucor ambiguus TaxID=91626 RepID=A0A0C9MN62_9FUNG|nr:carboxylesterase [Mucor ambiguus]